MLAPPPHSSFAAAHILFPFTSPQWEAVFIAEMDYFALVSDGSGHHRVCIIFKGA
jgi:hypothetical protein